MSAPAVVGLPLAFVLATCPAKFARLCQDRVASGEVAREPVRAVVIKDRWWALVQFERQTVGEIMFPLDAYAVENPVVGVRALEALCALRGVVAHEDAPCACVAP